MKSNLLSKVIMEKKRYYLKYKTKKNETISREAWFAASRVLADQTQKNHSNQMIDVDRILELDKHEFEERFSNWLDE